MSTRKRPSPVPALAAAGPGRLGHGQQPAWTRTLVWLLAAAWLTTGALTAQQNVLILVADDLGVDRVGVYGEHPFPGRTPHIDQLARRGVLFRNAWANPACSPTRAGVLTGRHAFRHKIGTAIPSSSNVSLSLDEIALPRLLQHAPARPYASAAVGKWHLGTDLSGGTLQPLLHGFDLHLGSPANLGPGNYFAWTKSINGTPAASDTYATTAAVRDGVRVIRGLPEPWFVWLAFNAPHQPFHAPPDELHSFNLTGTPATKPVPHMKAMTEAMDNEIGRLLRSIDPATLARTTIIFLGDNGTDGEATTLPFAAGKAKGTVYEGGLNVPLIICGPGVEQPGSECAALVHSTDLFATVAELADVDPDQLLPAAQQLDSVSLLPYLRDPQHPSLRRYVFSEIFSPNGNPPYQQLDRAIRDQRYKLIRQRQEVLGPSGPVVTDVDRLFDLRQDPFETMDLLPTATVTQQAAYQRLVDALDRLLASEG